MIITRSELLDVVYRHYPRGVHNFARIHAPPNEIFYDDTEEHVRLMATAARGRREWPTWEAMIGRLGDRYKLQNESLSLFAGAATPAYSARIWLTDTMVVNFHVSLLGPYYGIQLPGIPEEEPVAREVAREIETTYPGYQTIPSEIGNEVVPDVAMDGALMGEATIYTCIFSDVWTWPRRILPSPVHERPSMLDRLPGGKFVKRFVDDVDAALESRYPRLHEQVTKLRQLLPSGTISIEFAMPRRRNRTD